VAGWQSKVKVHRYTDGHCSGRMGVWRRKAVVGRAAVRVEIGAVGERAEL